MSREDWLILALEGCGVIAFALFAFGVTLLIVTFFSKWVGRLIENGPLGMWRK